MKSLFFIITYFIFSNILFAQDTLYMKNGEKIPALIVENGEVELKYRKSTQPESASIYAVFLTDIVSIHYKNGSVIDYSSYDPEKNKPQEKESLKKAGTVLSMRVAFGAFGGYGNRNEADNLRLFWRRLNDNNSLEMSGKQGGYGFNLNWGTALDANRRNWLGGGAQYYSTSPEAIHVSNYYYGSNEIKLKLNYINIMFFYGHSLNHKKNLILMFDPGIELGFMKGIFTIRDEVYKVSGMNLSAHLATGLDWIITKRIVASLRAGQHFMKIEESHKDSTSKTGYASFYVDSVSNQDLVNVNWSGSYVTFGVSFALYQKMN